VPLRLPVYALFLEAPAGDLLRAVAVVVLLLWASELFKKEPEKIASFKKRGDAILTQREAARKKD
jgi:hypothetical protein